MRTRVRVQSKKLLSPDDVIIVPQVKLLSVLSGVVDHAHPRHKVHNLLPGSVVEIVATLVTPVAVDPLQPQLAARRRLIGHVGSEVGPSCQSSTDLHRYQQLFPTCVASGVVLTVHGDEKLHDTSHDAKVKDAFRFTTVRPRK